MRKTALLGLLCLSLMAVPSMGQNLDLKRITQGAYMAEGMMAVTPAADGESYLQLSGDGQRVVRSSFKTGKEVETIFDVTTAHGAKLSSIDGYIMSPDGKRLLIQTNTELIYRHSFKAEYYIYTIANKKLVPLSKNGAQQTPLFSKDGTLIAFVRDNNIFLIKLLYDNAESQVTKDGRQNEVINGIPD